MPENRKRGFMLNKMLFPAYRVSRDVVSLEQVVPSTVFDLDATLAQSYPGSGLTWANLATAPADGSAQAAYDFSTGNGVTPTTYPAFQGSAGSAAAYWSFDGGDYFKIKAGVNTAFLAGLQRTDTGDWWMALTYRHADNTTNSTFFANKDSATNSVAGVSFYTTSGEVLFLRQGNNVVASSAATLPTQINATDYVIIASCSKANNNVRLWRNTATAANYAWTFGAYTANVATLATIGATPVAASPLLNNARLYSFAMGNQYLDNPQAAAIIAALEARHGRNYT